MHLNLQTHLNMHWVWVSSHGFDCPFSWGGSGERLKKKVTENISSLYHHNVIHTIYGLHIEGEYKSGRKCFIHYKNAGHTLLA